MSREMRIRALELFAGIGGQALALKTAGVKTIGYCEIDDVNCDILRANMERRRLDKAPIFSDVTKLNRQDLPTKTCGHDLRRISLLGSERSRQEKRALR